MFISQCQYVSDWCFPSSEHRIIIIEINYKKKGRGMNSYALPLPDVAYTKKNIIAELK